MPANIETHGDKAAFVEIAEAGKQTAWHQLGTIIPQDGELRVEDAMKLAHLTNWNVRKMPVTTQVGDLTLEVPDTFAVVRDNPFVRSRVDVLGTVGNYYQPFQNERHAELLNELVDQANAHVVTAGSLNDGKKIFITMKLPEAMMIGGEDRVDLYIIATNSHDGSSKFEFLVSPVRVVCQNTLTAAYREAKSRFGIRHTKNGEGKIAQAREALGLTWKYVEKFEADAERMIQEALTDTQFEEIVRGLYPEPEEDKKRAHTLWEAKFEAIVETYQEDSTQDAIKGTHWAGYQSITRFLDHVAPVPGEKSREDDGWVAQARAERTVSDLRFEDEKNRAFDAFWVPPTKTLITI